VIKSAKISENLNLRSSFIAIIFLHGYYNSSVSNLDLREREKNGEKIRKKELAFL
jgi:hypothetical protein